MYVAHVDLFIVLRYDVHAQASGVWPIVWPPLRECRECGRSVLQFSSVLETRLACKHNTIIPGPFAVGYLWCGRSALSLPIQPGWVLPVVPEPS